MKNLRDIVKEKLLPYKKPTSKEMQVGTRQRTMFFKNRTPGQQENWEEDADSIDGTKEQSQLKKRKKKQRPLHSYHLGIKMNRIKENTRDQIMQKTRIYFNKKITDKQLRDTGQTNSVMSEAKINDEIHYNTSVPHLKRVATKSIDNEARWVLTKDNQLHAGDAYNFHHIDMAPKNDIAISGKVFSHAGGKHTYLAYHGISGNEIKDHPLVDKFKAHGMKIFPDTYHPSIDENLNEAILTGHKSPHPLTLHIDKDYEELHRYSVKHKGKEIGFLNYNVPHNNVAWTKVEPKYRGQGIAMAMHKAVEKENGRSLSPADEYTEAGRAFATKFHGKDVAQGYKKDTAGKYIKESEESERKIHQNPGIGTMKELAKNSKSGTMKFYISRGGNMFAGDSYSHTHHSLGAHSTEIMGGVTYHPETGEHKYFAHKYAGSHYEDVTHPRLADYEKHGITRGKWNMNDAIVESVDENGIHHNTTPSRLMVLAKNDAHKDGTLGSARFVIDNNNKLHAGISYDFNHSDLSPIYDHQIRGFITHHPETKKTYFAAHTHDGSPYYWGGTQASAHHPILKSLEQRGAERGIVVGHGQTVRAPKGNEVPMQHYKWIAESESNVVVTLKPKVFHHATIGQMKAIARNSSMQPRGTLLRKPFPKSIPNITSEDFIVTKGKNLREIVGSSITMALFIRGVVYVYNNEVVKFIIPCDQLISFTSGNINVRVGNYILTYDSNGFQRSMVAIK